MITETQEEEFLIDDDAKSKIDLYKKLDSNGDPYYTGKLQANYIMDLNAGQSFMVFTADEGAEQIQNGPLHPARKKFTKPPITSGERITIPLKRHQDSFGNDFFVGELAQPATQINLTHGLFFTVFTSRKGHEQIQITPLKIKRKKK